MSADPIYVSLEMEKKGRVAVAARDVLPGELVVIEKKPLMYFTHSFLEQYETSDPKFKIVLASYNTFMTKLAPEKQEKFLGLMEFTGGVNEQRDRKYVRKMQLYSDNELNTRSLSSEEVDLFVHVASITRQKMITVGVKDKYAIFAEIARFSHSCDANCLYTLEGRTCSCYAKRFIPAGEELTICCLDSMDMEPTHERRRRYLEMKEFTCHCARCDALGDDTRQFDCSDAACNGVMLAFQPINKKATHMSGLQYDGIVYEEPHLLPCSACGRSAPPAYQTKMFVIEAQLRGFASHYQGRFDALMRGGRLPEIRLLLNEIQHLKFPHRHAAAIPLLCLEMQVKQALYVHHPSSSMRSSVQRSALAYIEAHENIFPHANKTVSKAWTVVSALFSQSGRYAIFPPREEMELCQKALRMHLLIHGRNNRSAQLDDTLIKVLERLAPLRSVEVCALCEESPHVAALALYRCGKCKKIAYCSAGCQKVHWKVHKKYCRTAGEERELEDLNLI